MLIPLAIGLLVKSSMSETAVYYQPMMPKFSGLMVVVLMGVAAHNLLNKLLSRRKRFVFR
jgi:hypothetical protein